MRDDIAKMNRLYYVSEHGRSHYEVECECGWTGAVYCWARCKKCPSCGKLLHLWLSGELEK